MTITKSEIVHELIKIKSKLWPNGGEPEEYNTLINSIFDDLKEIEQKKADGPYVINWPNTAPIPMPNIGIPYPGPTSLPPAPRYGDPFLPEPFKIWCHSGVHQ
jgi:hypothetical protein